MIEQALRFLSAQSQAAVEPQLVDETPDKRTYIINGGVATVHRAERPRAHKVHCLGDVVALANRFKDDSAGEYSPVVWYSENQVIAVFDDGKHRSNTVTLDLVVSSCFARVTTLRDDEEWHNQKDFNRLLRVDLAGCLTPSVLLDRVRKLRFENGTVTSGEHARQKESIGREIKAQIHADAELPEEVTLSIPVYSTAGERNTYPLRCAVELDAIGARLQLMPLPDEIESVRQLAVASIARRLAAELSEGIPSYYGKP